jgi:nitrogen-specific signal transduction histidine kinase
MMDRALPPRKRPIYSPHFTAPKTNGQGIGLMLIREILVNHDFDFNLGANENGNTEFWIKFDNREYR